MLHGKDAISFFLVCERHEAETSDSDVSDSGFGSIDG
jgi:hypothetical protein